MWHTIPAAACITWPPARKARRALRRNNRPAGEAGGEAQRSIGERRCCGGNLARDATVATGHFLWRFAPWCWCCCSLRRRCGRRCVFRAGGQPELAASQRGRVDRLALRCATQRDIFAVEHSAVDGFVVGIRRRTRSGVSLAGLAGAAVVADAVSGTDRRGDVLAGARVAREFLERRYSVRAGAGAHPQRISGTGTDFRRTACSGTGPAL